MTLHGIGITQDNGYLQPLVLEQIEETAKSLQVPFSIPTDRLLLPDRYVGDGYAIPTGEMKEAVKLVAETEGILLDVFTGKAMDGLIDLIKKNMFTKEDHILFVHTGGSPALFANTDPFLWMNDCERTCTSIRECTSCDLNHFS